MIKHFLLLSNIAALLLYHIFLAEGVNVTSNFPSTVKAGESYTIELIIKKPNISGFAKLQQELPPGFTATAIETESGSFSFSDQAIKLIWMSLPSKEDFKVTYKISVSGDASGTHTINGKLSYIENNEKKIFNLAPKDVVVEGGPVTASTAETVSSPKSTDLQSSEQPKADNSPDQSSANNSSASNSATEASAGTGTVSTDVISTRSMPSTVTSNEFTVEVTVQKKDISGFAKLEETLPSGFSATGLETQNAVFSFVDQKAKFLWMNLPAESSFKVAYKVKVDPSVTSSSYTIKGLFSFLINDVTQKSVIPQTTFTYKPGSTDITQERGADNETTKKVKTPEEKPTTPSLTNIPNPTKGVNYKIQVAATRKRTDPKVLKEQYKLQGNVYSEMHEGWYKFTIDSYNDYKLARTKRIEASKNKNIPGPFVTAYYNGKRITVQEALMISNQKWVK